MVYRKKTETEHAPGVAPCIAARLAPEWQFVSASKGFEHARTNESFEIKGLPPSTRVELRYPDFAGIPQSRLSDDEKELSRYVQFVFHPRARVDQHLACIRNWAMIESAHIVPMPSLPTMGSGK